MIDDEDIERALGNIPEQPGPVLRCLQEVQATFGFVPANAVSVIAEACNVSRADVHGVLTFYADLRTQAPPAVAVRLCAAEACQSVGARSLRESWIAECEADAALAETTGIDEPIYCLGNCALGPAAFVGDRLLGRVSVQSLRDEVERQASGVTA